LLFPKDPEQAIWVDEICPVNDPGNLPGEFKDPCVSGDRLTVSITNKNKEKKKFSYALRTQRNGSGRFEPYDPVIISGGGGKGLLGDILFLGPAVMMATTVIAVLIRQLSSQREGRRSRPPGRLRGQLRS
jgi:hypothetical protein